MVNVETTPATTPDDHMVAVVQASLTPHNLLPREHLVDKGYTVECPRIMSTDVNDLTCKICVNPPRDANHALRLWRGGQ
jgi:hypothetical protein